MVTFLVSYWRSGGDGLNPGDITVVLERFPRTDLEIEHLRDLIKQDLAKRVRGMQQVAIAEIIRLTPGP